MLSFLHSPTLISIHTGKTIALTRWTSVGKVTSLLFNMLSRLVITFLPRSKHLLIERLQSPSAVVLEPPQNKISHCFHCEKVGLKLNIQKTKIMVSSPITSWLIDGETMETVADFILGVPKSLEMVTAAMKLKDAYSLGEKL